MHICLFNYLYLNFATSCTHILLGISKNVLFKVGHLVRLEKTSTILGWTKFSLRKALGATNQVTSDGEGKWRQKSKFQFVKILKREGCSRSGLEIIFFKGDAEKKWELLLLG